MKLRNVPEKFKAFALLDTKLDFVTEESGSLVVKESKRYRIPNMLEPSLERVNKVWRFYSKKFMENENIATKLTKMSASGDINISSHLKILLDMKEQMDAYKETRDLTGMILTMRTMYAMLRMLGYKRDPHELDEYTEMDMSEQALKLLTQYGFVKRTSE